MNEKHEAYEKTTVLIVKQGGGLQCSGAALLFLALDVLNLCNIVCAMKTSYQDIIEKNEL